MPQKCEKKDKKSQELDYFGRKIDAQGRIGRKRKGSDEEWGTEKERKGREREEGVRPCCTLSKAVVSQHASHCINTRASFPRFLTDIDNFGRVNRSWDIRVKEFTLHICEARLEEKHSWIWHHVKRFHTSHVTAMSGLLIIIWRGGTWICLQRAWVQVPNFHWCACFVGSTWGKADGKTGD